MIILVKHIEQKTASNGNPYLDITGLDVKNNKDTRKLIFSELQEKWGLVQENKMVELVLKQTYKDGKSNWNVSDIKPAQETPPPTTPEIPEEHRETPQATKELKSQTRDSSGQTQRSISMSYAITLVGEKVITPDKLLSYAEVINRWITGDITVKDPSVFDEMVAKHFIEAH